MEKRYFVLPLVLTPCLAQQIVAQNNEPQRPNVVLFMPMILVSVISVVMVQKRSTLLM